MLWFARGRPFPFWPCCSLIVVVEELIQTVPGLVAGHLRFSGAQNRLWAWTEWRKHGGERLAVGSSEWAAEIYRQGLSWKWGYRRSQAFGSQVGRSNGHRAANGRKRAEWIVSHQIVGGQIWRWSGAEGAREIMRGRMAVFVAGGIPRTTFNVGR